MNLSLAYRLVLQQLCYVLPEKMVSDEANALLLAIGSVETAFRYRSQIDGPAQGFWSFQADGTEGVLTHPASAREAHDVAMLLGYSADAQLLHDAMRDNDLLSASWARLLLWRDQAALPSLDTDPEVGWQYYLRLWKPGAPRRDAWDRCWTAAINEVQL